MKAIKSIVLIVGHGAGDPGAIGWNGMSEFNYNSFVAESVAASLNKSGYVVNIVYRGEDGIKGAAKKAMAFKADITIELHLNAFNKKAKGCCVLTLGDKVSVDYGNSFSVAFCKKFQRVLRDVDGVVVLKKNERGAYSLALCDDPPPSILVESFFIDNKDEWVPQEEYIVFFIEWIKSL